VSEAIYRVDGDRFVPGLESRATWYEEAQHGGPVAALLAREIEQVEVEAPMLITRLTVDLMRPVPVSPLRVQSRVIRHGRRIQVLEAQMSVDDVDVARASALRIRIDEVGIPDQPGTDVPPSPDLSDPLTLEPAGERFFHTAAVEVRVAHGSFYEHGPAAAWFRLTMPIVEGEEPSPLQRTAAAADFGNGVSRVLGREYVFMNPDLTLHLHRHPVGEWVCLRARSDVEPDGIGLAQSELYDERGRLGHALQSLFVDTRERFGE